MHISQTQADLELNEKLTLYVDPRKIDLYAGSKHPLSVLTAQRTKWLPVLFRKWTNRTITRHHPFLVPERWLPPLVNIVQTEKYCRIESLIANIENYHRSSWYEDLKKELEEKGRTRHKNIKIKSTEDLDSFFKNYACELISSMQEKGYIEERGHDVGAAFILGNGTIAKAASGNHRFFVAKKLGLTNIPIRIVGIDPKALEDHAALNFSSIIKALEGAQERYI